MLRAIISARSARASLVAIVGFAAAGMPGLSAQEGGTEVEILSGNETRVEGAAETAGVRVISFVEAAGGAASYRVVEPLRSTEVLGVQRALAGAGFDPGATDGLMGPVTRSALRRFQTAAGTDACGCVDYATITGLGLRPLVVQTVIGDAADEPAVEIIVAPRPIEPETSPRPPAPETVFVTTATRPAGSWIYPAFPVGIPVIIGPGGPAPAPAPPAGVPFGAPIRLGPPATRPPPRP